MLYLAQQPCVQCQDTKRALQAADGYLYLGMPCEALSELNRAPSAAQRDPAVLLARVRVLLHWSCWKEAEVLARQCRETYPTIEEFTVQCAFALHQLEREDEAMETLRSAPDWILRTGILHYNLACYEARLGDLDVARSCIEVAIRMNSAMEGNAKVDPDLKALYN
jgi:tetratricopeptide (TPR) repeat protein